jgi:RHS repeat-associated protein
VQILGTEPTTPDGSDHVAKYGWLGNGVSTEVGDYHIIVEAGGKSLESTFSVEKLANVAVTGHGKWLDGKGIANTKPAPEEPIVCPLVPWDQVDAYKTGVVPNINVLDPVNIAFGNFLHSEVDLTLKSRQPITVARIYNSLDNHIGMFGRGWSSPYASRLEFVDSGVLFVNADGSRLFFSEESGTYVGPEGSNVSLASAPATGFWTIKQPSGTEWTFDELGKLIRMTKGCCGTGATSEVFLTYNASGHLEKVTNPAGQWIQFTFNADGLVTLIADFTGRQLQYAYNTDKQLILHTDPIGRTTDYSYNEDGFLTQIRKPGDRTTGVVYDGTRVCLLTDPNGNTSTFSWDIDNHILTLTDPQGEVHQYVFNSEWQLTGHTVLTLGITNQFTSDGAVMTEYQNSEGNRELYAYSSDGFIESKTDFAGQTTAFEYHPTLHLLTKKTDPLGRVWEYDWCSRGNLVSEKNPAGKVTLYTYDSHNNRTGKTDPLGRVTQWIYDNTGNFLVQTVDAEGGISSFSYDPRGNLMTSTDPLGRVTNLQYDALDRLVKTIYPDGRFAEIEYDSAGNVTLRRDNLGRETRYLYDPSDRLVTLTRPDGTVFHYAYNPDGKKISETDPLSRETRFEYNPNGLLTKTIYPDGSEESFVYDTESRLTSRTNELGKTTDLEYDSMGRLLCTIDPTGARWESQYDAAGRKIADKDPLNRVTSYQFDNLDRITKVIRPDNSFVTNSFDVVGNLLSTVDALGNQWSWVYDGLNRQIRAIQPNGASSTTTFDAAGQVISETDALNRTTQFTFDNGGRRTATKDALGNIWQNIYDSAGRLIATKDPMGAVSSLTYDIMDRVISQSDALGNVTSFEFDAVGRRVAKTDAEGRRSITVFNDRDRVTTEVDPEGHTVSYGYNLVGQRVSLTDAANRTWRWEHDSLGHVTTEFDPLDNTNLYAFDRVGNRTSWTNARNQTTAYSFNEMNRLSQIAYPDGTLATMTYDLEGRELTRSGPTGTVTKTWDSVGNMTSETFGPWGKKWQYSFDLVGNRTQAIDPEGQVFKYRVDALNRVISLDPPDKGDEIKFAFDAAGRPVTEERPGVKTVSTFDPAGRLLEMRHECNHGKEKIVASRKYTYSAAGNRLTMKDENNSITRYFYNGSDWLTKAVYPDGQTVAYGYNGAGDRIEEMIETPTVKGRGRHKVIGTDTVLIPMAYDACGRLVSRASDTFVFDADGNQVTAVENGDESRFFWSPDNRLVKVEKDIECHRHGKKRCRQCPQIVTLSESYTYEPESWRRLTRKTNDAELISVYDGNDESGEYLLKETGHRFGWKCDKHKFFCKCPAPKPGKKLELIRQFIGGPGTDDLELTKYHGRKLWTLKDGIGSTIALTNRGGHAVARIGYDAFGNFRFPDKPGHGVKPCDEKDLPDWLDRLDLGRSFGFDFDGHHWGRHFGAAISPYLFASRKWDGFSKTYNHRNRQMNPKFGRFITKDPIGFRGGLNLYRYANNNPALYTDPFGLLSQCECEGLAKDIENLLKNMGAQREMFSSWKPGMTYEDFGLKIMSTASGHRNKGELSKFSPIGRKAIEEFESGWSYNSYECFLRFAASIGRIFIFSEREMPEQAQRMDMIMEMFRTKSKINELSQMFRQECQGYPISLPVADF